MTKNKIRILLADDHTLVRKALKNLLELEVNFTVVGEATDGVSAVELAIKLKPDLIILDIAMPKLTGIEASRRILRHAPESKILILSAYSDDGYIETLSSFGVYGYLIKQCSPTILVSAVNKIAVGHKTFFPTIEERITALKGVGKFRTPIGAFRKKNLSEREAQVLQLIAEGRANKQIADDLTISIKTVEKHRQNLMNKLAIHDTAGLTRYAIAEGVIERPPRSYLY